MRFNHVGLTAPTIDDVWFGLVRLLFQYGRRYRVTEGSFAGTDRLEFDLVSGTILKPLQYTDGGVRLPLAVTVPQGIPAPTSEEKIQEYFLNYLMDGNKEGREHYRYSTFIVGGEYELPQAVYYGVDKGPCGYDMDWLYEPLRIEVPNQLQWCIDHYKAKGFGNNHCCIQVGYPESNLAYDIQYDSEMERGTSPCLRLIDTKIIQEDGEHYLCFTVYFRSWDIYGWPENIGGLALLLEYMAGMLEIKPGTLSFVSKGLHAYEHALEPLKSRVGL